MNIREINNSTPRWSAVVTLGLPLAVVTVALPLAFNFGYRKGTEFVAKNPRLFKTLTLLGGLLLGIVIIIIIISTIITSKK